MMWEGRPFESRPRALAERALLGSAARLEPPRASRAGSIEARAAEGARRGRRSGFAPTGASHD
jgi:hypothetical protein